MRLLAATAALFALFVLAGSLGFAQEPQPVPMRIPPSGGYRMLTQDGKTAVPFEFISNHVVIPVEVNGHTFKLILDTGMPVDGALLLGSEAVDGLGLEFIGKAPVMGPGGGRVDSDLAMGVSFELPGVELTNQMILVMPPESTRSRHFEGKDGVIGRSLFSHFVVRIDYDSMKVTLTEPERFEYTGSGRELPVRIDRYPFLVCEASIVGDASFPLELVLDTGNGAASTLNIGAEEGLVLPEKVIEYHTRSVGQEIIRLTGRIKRLQFGPYVFTNLLSSFRTSDHGPAPPWERAGALGQEVLRRFNVVFDYAHSRIILEPNGHFDEPFEFNMAGIQFIRASQGGFQVTRVIPGSPASDAGLRAGDYISQINGQTAGQLGVDDAERLLRREGTEVTLDVLRGDESIHVRFTLRRLI
ncbi:MAG: aspartyl protease family protein [Candidatus Eiseniibacteriota bacterium]|nr:MAG: aspartyl protease family protein [Candidatus Eisenbacteria bacterium]